MIPAARALIEMAAAFEQMAVQMMSTSEPHRPPPPNYQPLGEKGGEEYDEEMYTKAMLRADLVEITTKYSFNNGTKLVDEILKRYDVKRKSTRAPARKTGPPKALPPGTE